MERDGHWSRQAVPRAKRYLTSSRVARENISGAGFRGRHVFVDPGNAGAKDRLAAEVELQILPRLRMQQSPMR